jgi:hypothetical protein
MSEQRAEEIMREVKGDAGNSLLALARRIARLEIEIERINDSRSLRG